MTFPMPFAVAAAGVEPVEIDLLYSNGVPGSAQSKLYSAVSYGAAAANRRLLVVAFGGGGAAGLDAFTASQVRIQRFLTTGFLLAGVVDMPEGTSGDVLVDWASTKASFGLHIYSVKNLQQIVPVDGGFTPFSGLVASANLNVPAGGAAVGYVVGGGTASRTVTWSGIDEKFDAYIRTTGDGYPEMHSGAAKAFAAAQEPIAVSATLSGALADGASAYLWALR